MRKGDDALEWLEWYFSNREGYLVVRKHYGNNVPSNNVRVEGPQWFRFSFCPSWAAPQVSCALNQETLGILRDVFHNIQTATIV